MKHMIPFLSCLLACFIGNYMGDQETIKDCATKGEAVMFGGGKVKCEVVKEAK